MRQFLSVLLFGLLVVLPGQAQLHHVDLSIFGMD